ncbi:MAG: hypothetical protein M4579_007731, partial [Chaenotheca gracillima]
MASGQGTCGERALLSLAQKVKKWEYGINMNKVSREEVREYIQAKLYFYVEDRVGDSDLWDLFREDFKDFDVDIFKQHTRATQRIRQVLRCGGVVVAPHTSSITIAQRVAEVLLEEDHPAWTPGDLCDAEMDLRRGPIRSVWIKPGPK